ncbi:MAG TPA: alpha-amylase family glycosyl hydrolase [Oscillatoriaceae cyanobacterium]
MGALGLAAMLLAGCAHGPLGEPAFAAGTQQALSARASVDSWRDDNIYFVLTDRFFDGDRANDMNVDKQNPNAYHGGDFQGVIDKLDYLKNLGVTAIWVTPINDNIDGAFVGKYWAFHGYWIKDFTKVDEHLGTEEKFRELVRDAHAKGIKVLLDIVVNHAGYGAPIATNPQTSGWFHHNGNITNWDDQHQLEYNDIDGLPDFNTENPQVIQYMEQTWAGWIQRTGVDGFRIDTVKHVPIAFWSVFNAYIHAHAPSGFFELGEVLNGDPDYLQPYLTQGGFNSLFDYPMYYTFDQVFAQGGSMRQLAARFAQDNKYPDASLLSPFLDNHDQPRFLTRAGGDERKLRLALACLYTMRGVPMLYYGTECGMQGGPDPDNRKDMAWGQDSALTQYVSTLLHLRTASEPLRRGRQLEMWQDDQVYGFARLDGKQEVDVLLNNADSAQTRQVPLRAESALPDGTVLVDQLSGDRFTVQHHQLAITLGPKQARVLAPATSRARTGRK